MIDHYEIQSALPNGEWVHIGNKYPDYKWKIHRPWYLFGLVRCPRITNKQAALKQTRLDLANLVIGALKLDKTARIRIICWRRFFFVTITGEVTFPT